MTTPMTGPIRISTSTRIGTFVLAMVAGLALSGCTGKPDLEELVEIKPNETAIMVKLEGDNKTGQAKFMSEEFLEANKIATKRVAIPHRKRTTGNGVNDYEWIPTVKLIVVDRAPVTREWTSGEKTGTSAKNEGIKVESLESIDFTIGVVMTASITEEGVSKFLYHYAGKPLAKVADEDIRGYIQGILSREFGVRKLAEGQTQKKDIFDLAAKETSKHFAALGVNIINVGYSEGMTYADQAIQKAINENFEASQAVLKATYKVEAAKQERLAAEEFAKAKDASVAKTQLDIEMLRAQAEVKRADAALLMANKFNGVLPNLIPQGTQLLNGLDAIRK